MTTSLCGVSTATRFSAAYALLRASAAVADHWVQSTHQAANKGWHDGDTDAQGHAHTSAEGRKACAAHVASYVATQGLVLAIGNKALNLGLKPSRVLAALALSGVTHYVADRRRPLKCLAGKVGKAPFYALSDHGMNGAYALDQSYHHLFETVAAAVAAR